MTKELTREKVILYWALAEVASPRWEKIFAAEFDAETMAFLRSVADPETLPRDLQEKIVGVIRRRREGFLKDHVDHCTRFSFVALAPADIGKLVLPTVMSCRTRPVTLGFYINGPYKEETWHDPRNAAKRMLANPEKVAYFGYPIVAPDASLGCEVLVEGYCRCIARLMELQAGKNVEPLTVIRCEK